MKVSVVIPAHNEEKFIDQTLKTVLLDTYSDKEIIVVDNNSTDQTAEIVAHFPVKLMQESNKGTQFARERGRQGAGGEIIANLDADCLPQSNWLTQGIRWFEDENVVAVTGPYDYYDASPFFRSFSLFVQRIIYSIINSLFQNFNRGIIVEGNVLFRADALEKVGGYNTVYTFYGDGTDMARRLSKIGRIIFDRSSVMPTSARRFKKEGAFKISFLYIYYFFKTALISKNQ